MSKHQKRKTSEKKLEIINYSKANGNAKTSRQFGVSVSSIINWTKAYESVGMPGLSKIKQDKTVELELKKLKRENDQLKKIVAEKELRIRIQEDMLKKSH